MQTLRQRTKLIKRYINLIDTEEKHIYIAHVYSDSSSCKELLFSISYGKRKDIDELKKNLKKSITKFKVILTRIDFDGEYIKVPIV